jgi:ubiquinone biosynthesis protein
VRKQIAEDFVVLTQIARFLDAHTDLGRRHRFGTVLDEFRNTIQHELDYQREAQNLVTLRENLKDFRLIQVPRPFTDYCTSCVLTMERVQGHKITSMSPLAMLEVDGAVIAEELFRAYLKQVLVDGFFHADPHPGNVFLADDGRVALLDLGMVGHTTPAMQETLLKLLLAITEGNSDRAADLVINMSEKSQAFDPVEFRRRIGQLLAAHRDQALEELNVGRSLLEVSSNASQNGLFVPSELTLLGKTLLQLDEIGRVLDSRFDPNAAIRRNVAELITRRMWKNSTQGSLITTLLEAKSLVQALPSQLHRILDGIANAGLEVKVRSLDSKMVVEGIEKVANRITVGLVLAALIVGAALLMRVETSFRLFGYPGLAILCFLAAAAGGFWLVAGTLARDHRDRKKRRRR